MGNAIIAAVALVVVAAIGYLPHRRTRQVVCDIKSDVSAVKRDTAAIDHAVNNQQSGMPTMVQRLTSQDQQQQLTAAELAAFRLWSQGVFQVFAVQLGVEIEDPPPPVVTPPMARPAR